MQKNENSGSFHNHSVDQLEPSKMKSQDEVLAKKVSLGFDDVKALERVEQRTDTGDIVRAKNKDAKQKEFRAGNASTPTGFDDLKKRRVSAKTGASSYEYRSQRSIVPADSQSDFERNFCPLVIAIGLVIIAPIIQWENVLGPKQEQFADFEIRRQTCKRTYDTALFYKNDCKFTFENQQK